MESRRAACGVRPAALLALALAGWVRLPAITPHLERECSPVSPPLPPRPQVHRPRRRPGGLRLAGRPPGPVCLLRPAIPRALPAAGLGPGRPGPAGAVRLHRPHRCARALGRSAPGQLPAVAPPLLRLAQNPAGIVGLKVSRARADPLQARRTGRCCCGRGPSRRSALSSRLHRRALGAGPCCSGNACLGHACCQCLASAATAALTSRPVDVHQRRWASTMRRGRATGTASSSIRGGVFW